MAQLKHSMSLGSHDKPHLWAAEWVIPFSIPDMVSLVIGRM